MIKQPITMPVVVRPWPTWQLNTMAGKGADELLSNSWGMSLMALMNWSKSCSSGALVAVIGILEYLRINTVVIIPSCTCSRTKPPIQMAVWLDKHSFPTLQRKDCVTNPKEVRFAMVHYLFSGGGGGGEFLWAWIVSPHLDCAWIFDWQCLCKNITGPG